MTKKHGFLHRKRKVSEYRPVHERVNDFKDVVDYRIEQETIEQATRCMDCGTPFCHFGCPIDNLIPEFNDALYNENWKKAFELLNSTNPLPEITGRLCPALCEAACVLGINDDSVTVRENEVAIIEKAFKEGYIKPESPVKKTGKKVAVIGSGPAGLAASINLNRMGHEVTLFEKDKKLGGLLRYGIPDFKLEKWVLDRRIKLMEQEGIKFRTGVCVGVDIKKEELEKEFDSICITAGCGVPRDLNIKGRDAQGIYFAMEYLTQVNIKHEEILDNEDIDIKKLDFAINAKDKNVVVIGGGDTGSDCLGTAIRQGAKSVTQIELMPKPPLKRTGTMPWPEYPMIFRTSSSHLEGGTRDFSVLTKEFIKEDDRLKKLKCVKIEFVKDEQGKNVIKELEGSEFEIEVDLVVLALGFVFPEKQGLISSLGLELTERGTIKTNDSYQTSIQKIFAAGDVRRGASLIVWAIKEANDIAVHINNYLSC